MSRDFVRNRDEIIQDFLTGGGDQTIKSQSNRLDDSYLDEFSPLEIEVRGNNFDKAFKMFRNLVQKERVLALYKQKQSFEKPSEKRRRKQNEMRQKRMELEAKRQKILSGEFEKELLRKQKAKELKKQLKLERMNNSQVE